MSVDLSVSCWAGVRYLEKERRRSLKSVVLLDGGGFRAILHSLSIVEAMEPWDSGEVAKGASCRWSNTTLAL